MELTITDTVTDENGDTDGSVVVGAPTEYTYATGTTLTNALLTIESGSFSSVCNSGSGIGGPGAELHVEGGELTAQGHNAAGIGSTFNTPGITTIVSGGTVTAVGGMYSAGIGGGPLGQGGTTTITGGTVIATAGDYGAAIGGGSQGAGGTTTITGGNVTATGGYQASGIGGGQNAAGGTITIDGGDVTATGGENGSGIGGGLFATGGGTLDIGAGAVVTASASQGNAVGTLYAGTIDLSVDGTLVIPSDAVLTIPENTVVTGTGTVTGRGAVVNNGILAVSTVEEGPGSLTVSGVVKRLAFASGDDVTPVVVYAPTFEAGNRTIPAAPAPNGRIFFGWNAGDGTVLAPTDALPESATFAAKEGILTVVVPESEQATVGQVPLSVYAADSVTGENLGDYTAASTITTDADTTYDPATATLSFTTLGPITVTATLDADPTVVGSAILNVLDGPATRLELARAPLSGLIAGESITLTAAAFTEHGYDSPLAPGDVAFTSSETTDVAGTTPGTFSVTAAGTRTFTATLVGTSVATSIVVVVSPAATASLLVERVGDASAIGRQSVFTATGVDRFGNVGDDVTRLATFASTGAGDVATFRGVFRIGSSGDRTVSAALDGDATIVGSTVVSAPLLAFGVFSKPTIGGTVAVGAKVTATATALLPDATTISYQWLRNGVVIAGATKVTYSVPVADLGARLSVVTTSSKPDYVSVTATSDVSSIVAKGTLSGPLPVITGTAAVAKMLTATPGTWSTSPVSRSYQWLRNGVAISGATKSTYKTTSADKGKTIRVAVTGVKNGYTTLKLTSAGTKIAK
jgi:hypothetical protein